MAVVGRFLNAERFAIEIFHNGRAVVLLDEIDDRLRQLVLAGEGHAVFDVADDDQRAEGRLQDVMAVLAGLVLDEVLRLEHLADVVIVRADSHQQPIGADPFRGRFGNRGDRNRMVVRSRSASNQLLKQRMGDVAHLQQADIGHNAEGFFDKRQAARNEIAGDETPAGDNQRVQQRRRVVE